MTIGFRRIIKDDDLFQIEEEMSSVVLVKRFQKVWSTANKARPNALFWSTLKAARRPLALCVFPRLCVIGFRYSQPFLLSRTIDFVKSTNDTKNVGWGLTGAFGIVFVGTAIANALSSHMSFRFSTAVRGTLVGMICMKIVELRSSFTDESAAVTLMSTDTETICGGVPNLHEIWAVPVELGLALWLLYRELGLSFLSPAAIVFISTACVMAISPLVGAAQKRWNEGIQTRVNITTDVLGSIKAVKMLGYTPKVTDILQDLRVNELKLSSMFRRLLCATTFFSNNMRVLAPFITFAVYVLIPTSTKPGLTPASAFTTLSLIGMLSNPVSALLRTIPMLKSALACFERIQRFLDSPCHKCSALSGEDSRDIRENELSRESGAEIIPSDGTQSEAIVLGAVDRRAHVYVEPTILAVRNASFSWTADGPAVIDNITFSVRRSSITFIIGPVGCGKSTLLKGILNETPFSTGYCANYTTGISFVEQSPWIQNVSIRQNIIGASQLDGSWYDKVVQVCALEHDIAGFSDSHDTVVGSRGISLSGGQKQRVGLARALYAKKELMIIDDGVSGLDAETEEAMFSGLMSKNGLLKQVGTTVILVTNAVDRLPLADHIICLDAAGSVTEQGKFDQLQSSGGYVQSLFIREKSEYKPKVTAKKRRSIDNEAGQISLPRDVDIDDVDLDRQIGEWSTYRYYFASIGWLRSIISLFYLVVSGVAVKLTELLITYWASAVSDHGDVANPFYLGFYGMLSGIGTIFWNIATYHYFLYVVPGSAEGLHAKLLNSVMNAPLYFFTNTDTGVTTNRFSQDMSAIDKELPFALIDLIVAVVQTIVGAILMCLATGYFASALPVIILIIWVIQKFYLRTSRQIRLLDLEAKSPLYTHFIECLSGLVTIRAFGWSNTFVERAMTLLDNSQKPYYLLFCIQRWLSIVLDLMVAILAVLIMVLVVELRESVQPGYVGLALLNILSFSSSLIWIVKQWTALETSIGAVSRLKKFTATTPDENCQGESERVSDAWPTKGAIEFRITSASYHPSGNLVLQDINLSIKAGERIGVCGRSGSGKSSLIMALFRLLEISPNSSIIVDGVDITKIPRQIVRSRLNGIPQDSFMMKGSVRLNASPELRHSDLEIIEALRRVDLWSLIDSKGGLDAEVDREFFSHGQRQLFCLARSILRKSRIIVLDEVSSSIDVATDKFIQQVIREEFASATIISVAHRLDTIMDFDKIAVLKDGRLVEFEAPQVLLALPSAFRELYNSRDNSHALL